MAQVRRYSRLEILKYQLLAIIRAKRPLFMALTILDTYRLQLRMWLKAGPWRPSYWRSRRLFKKRLEAFRSTHP